MPLDVFTNREAATKSPDAIISPSGQIFTNFELSPEAALPENILYQVPTVRAYQLSGELPILGTPASNDSFWSGRGFFHMGTRIPYFASDPISIENAGVLSDTVSQSIFHQIIEGSKNPTPPNVSDVIAQYHVSQGTIDNANAQVSPKIQAAMERYKEAMRPRLADSILNYINAAWLSVVSLFNPEAIPAVVGVVTMQSGINMGVAAANDQKITVDRIALAAAPAVLYGTGVAVASPAETVIDPVYFGFDEPLSAAVSESNILPYAVSTKLLEGTTLAQRIVSGVNEAAPVAEHGPKLVDDLRHGKVGAFFADLGRAFGLPIPEQHHVTIPGGSTGSATPSPSQFTEAAGGVTMPDFEPAAPYEANTGQWIVGAVLLVLIAVLVMRKKG